MRTGKCFTRRQPVRACEAAGGVDGSAQSLDRCQQLESTLHDTASQLNRAAGQAQRLAAPYYSRYQSRQVLAAGSSRRVHSARSMPQRQHAHQYTEQLQEDASFTWAGTLARQAVGLGDSKTLRKFLESSKRGRKEASAAVDAHRGW